MVAKGINWQREELRSFLEDQLQTPIQILRVSFLFSFSDVKEENQN